MQSENALEAFLYIVTHDLKTYSRALRVIPDWIEEDMAAEGLDLPQAVVENISMMQHYARGLDRMLDGLTELSRVGRLADPPSRIVMRDALDTAWTGLDAPEGFTLDLDAVSGVVQAPANDLDRLLGALLSNAVRHHDRDAGAIIAETEARSDRLVLRLADDGPGIDADYHEKVFQPLYTLRPKDQVETAGMGLAVARKVVETLRGEIALGTAQGGRGLVVRCDLPADGQAS